MPQSPRHLSYPALLLSSPLPVNHTDHAAVTMGVPWKTADQKAFVETHTPSYIQHVANNTRAAFWLDFLDKWFRAWPLGDPPVELVEKTGSVLMASRICRESKIAVSTIYLLKGRLELTVRVATEVFLQNGQ